MRTITRRIAGSTALVVSIAGASLGARDAHAGDGGGGWAAIGGLRLNLASTLDGTDLTPDEASRMPAGLMVWQSGAVWGYSGVLSGRLWSSGGLGAGSTGLEGALGGGLGIGAFAPLDGDGMGPFLRVGFDGEMMGNQYLYLSWIEAPQVRAGFQIAGAALELGVHTGVVAAGRFNLGHDARRDDGGGWEIGPYAALGPAEISWMHVASTDPALSAVDIFRANLLFFEIYYVHGSTQFGVPTQVHDSTAVYMGIALAWGSHGSL